MQQWRCRRPAQAFEELKASIDRLSAAIIEQFDVPLQEVLFVRPTTFPRTSSGKLQRRLCRQMYLDQRFETLFDGLFRASQLVNVPTSLRQPPETNGSVASASPMNLEATICRALRSWAEAEQKTLPPLDGTTTFSSLGIDSLAAASIALQTGAATRHAN